MAQLFRASSVFPVEKKEELTHNWFRTDRVDSVLPYDVLIRDYHSLSADKKTAAEHRANQFLTAEELELLKNYIRKTKGMDVNAEEIPLPMDPGRLRAYSTSYKIELWKESGYSLPFRVEARVEVEIIPDPQKIDTGTQD